MTTFDLNLLYYQYETTDLIVQAGWERGGALEWHSLGLNCSHVTHWASYLSWLCCTLLLTRVWWGLNEITHQSLRSMPGTEQELNECQLSSVPRTLIITISHDTLSPHSTIRITVLDNVQGGDLLVPQVPSQPAPLTALSPIHPHQRICILFSLPLSLRLTEGTGTPCHRGHSTGHFWEGESELEGHVFPPLLVSYW